MPKMRAKVKLNRIEKFEQSERLHFNAVCKSDGYDSEGCDENNTYAKFSPQADFQIHVCNPALIGQFSVGETYYVDFTQAEK
jgi:hypothetical protein